MLLFTTNKNYEERISKQIILSI